MRKALRRLRDGYGRFAFSGNWIPECAFLCAYILLVSLVMYYHEPWYDEAQAWLISRDASWREIFLEVPHYEGHPPFWFALLALFSKAGADFELTLEILTLVVNAFAMWLLLFRSPFPRIVRMALPFTYFLFYQHGVICRPYSLLLTGLLLTASFWRERDEKPFRTVLALMLCCVSSAYGIIFAGGITLAWLGTIAAGRNARAFLKELFSGRRLAAFFSLLAVALVNIALIFPREDTFAASFGTNGNPIWLRLLYMFTGSVADALGYSCFEDYAELRYISYDPGKLAFGCVVGGLLVCLILYAAWRCGTMGLFLTPFVLFAGFSGTVYFYLQHVDVLFQFLLFWSWVSYEKYLLLPAEKKSPSLLRTNMKFVTCLVSGFCIAVSLYWSAAACRNEVLLNYGFAGKVSAFLDNHGLTPLGIMVRWKLDVEGDAIYMNTNQTVNGVALNAYFDRNIVTNMNGGDPGVSYATHRIPTEEETERTIEAWREAGLPAVTLDCCQLDYLFPGQGDLYRSRYVKALFVPEYHLWKAGFTYSGHIVYVRKDVARKYRLEPLD